MAVTKRKKGYYIYFRPFRQDLVGVATDAKSKTEARQIEMALLKACRTGDYGALDPTTREVCVRMFQNQSWALPDQLETTLPTSGELTLWKGIRQCLTYPGMKDSSNRERHEQAFPSCGQDHGAGSQHKVYMGA